MSQLETMLRTIPNRDEMSKLLSDQSRALRELQLQRPNPRRLVASGRSDASGNLILDLGAPTLRNKWVVRRISLCGVAAPFTILNGWGVFITSSTPSSIATLLPESEVGVVPTAAGNLLQATADAIACLPNEHLIVALSAAAATTDFVANARVEEELYTVPEVSYPTGK